MIDMLESLKIFVDHIDELVGVFESDYDGGDFCTGLSFGSAGSNLLFNIAESVINHTVKANDNSEKDL